jgi:hypothetical protein
MKKSLVIGLAVCLMASAALAGDKGKAVQPSPVQPVAIQPYPTPVPLPPSPTPPAPTPSPCEPICFLSFTGPVCVEFLCREPIPVF